MKMLLTLMLTFPTVLFAKQIELKISNEWVSEGVSGTNLTTVKANLGRSWHIPLEGTSDRYLKMTASESTESKEIVIYSEIFKVQDGKESVLSKGMFSTTLGKEASMESGTLDGKEVYKVKVTPIKVADKI